MSDVHIVFIIRTMFFVKISVLPMENITDINNMEEVIIWLYAHTEVTIIWCSTKNAAESLAEKKRKIIKKVNAEEYFRNRSKLQ